MRIGKEFKLANKVCVVVGGAGLLGGQFCTALYKEGANVVSIDLDNCNFVCDITKEEEVRKARKAVLDTYKRIDVLVNCVANDPKAGDGFPSLENFSLDMWNADLAVGLTGMFLCCKVFGSCMATRKNGVIVNIASDLSVIAPDQRIYQNGPKPVSYSVLKHGVIGLTKYLATYWADKGVRVNALSPGGVYNKQSYLFVKNLINLIPMGRMATVDEYNEALIFLCSDASAYMTGQNLVIDGGRTTW